MTELAESIQAEVGDALRIAAVYAKTGFDQLYLRDDLETQYTPAELETLRREIIVLALGKEKLEAVTHAGKFRQAIYETDDALAIQVPLDDHSGVFVSIESSERARLFDVVETVWGWIERRERGSDDASDR